MSEDGRVSEDEYTTPTIKRSKWMRFYGILYRLGEWSFYIAVSLFFLMGVMLVVGIHLPFGIVFPFYMPLVVGGVSAIISLQMWRVVHKQYDPDKDVMGRKLAKIKFLIRILIMILLVLGAYLSVPIVMIAGFFLWGAGVIIRYLASLGVDYKKRGTEDEDQYSRHWFWSLIFIALEVALPVMLGFYLLLSVLQTFFPALIVVLSLVVIQLILKMLVAAYNDPNDIVGVSSIMSARAAARFFWEEMPANKFQSLLDIPLTQERVNEGQFKQAPILRITEDSLDVEI